MAPKNRKGKGDNAAQNDPRFASITTDPRYRLPSAKHSRVNVDNRFSRMFKDDDFSKKATVDRYGRKLGKGTGKKDLEKFYRLEGKNDKTKAKGKQSEVVGSDDEDEDEDEEEQDVDDDDEVQAELDRVERKGASVRDYAREGGFSDSSSDDDTSDEEEDSDEDEEEQTVVEFPDEQQAPEVPMGEVSNRLAVVNLDWDNIRAADLMAVAQSFAPAGGKGVQRVVVYPSEFGKERMEREELEGPPREIFASSSSKRAQDDSEEEDSEDEEERIKKELLTEDTGEEFDSAKLRQYQLDRLKYYYAVITCESKETAKGLYDDMDGREYLTTANFFDLRFIPDEVSFDDDAPRDECTKLPPGYKPNEFVTDALTHSKVRLTWDADDTTRKEVQKRAFSRAEIDENDLQAYIGSDSSDDEDEAPAHADGEDAPKLSKAEQQRQKMRAALGLTGATAVKSSAKKVAAPVGDMQVTFTSGLSGPAGSKKEGASVFENDPAHVNETTREKYIRKEKERKERRKAKAKAIRAGEDPDAVGGESSEGEKEAEAAPGEDDLGFNDPFFTDMPAAQKAEKEVRKAEKAKKRQEREEADRATAAQRAELELLMVDDKADASMRHFDMNEIARAEKQAKKRGKKGSKKGKDGENINQKQAVDGADFKIETQDPRFSSLFESHEFAIDPTNPRFQKTAGMQALLEEGRKKRKGRGNEEGDEEERSEKKAKKESKTDEGDASTGGEDLQKLLARVKAKTKKR